MTIRTAASILLACVLVSACVSTGPAASSAPTDAGSSVAPTGAGATSPAETTDATATDAPATTEPTQEPAKTPKPSKRPRPTPTTPPDIDVFPRDVLITPITDDLAAGYHVDINFVITNTGTDRAKKFTVTVTCLGYSQDQEVFGGIEPGGDYDIAFGFYASIPGDLDYARVVADSTEKITETDEDNNTLELPLTGDPSCARPPT